MNKLISSFLQQYDPAHFEKYLKAKFLLVTILVAILGLMLTIAYTSYTFGFFSLTVIGELVGLALMSIALLLLVRGKNAIAGHIVLISGFSVSWAIMFIEPISSPLIKLDTIVFVLVLLSATPLMFFENRKPLIFYYLINLLIFITFNFILIRHDFLTQREYIDYALDNIIAMLFMLVISYNLFSIYQKVLDSLRNELRERIKIQNSLKQLRKLLTSIINSMPSLIIGIDKTMKIVLWSEKTAEETGLTEDTAMGKELFSLIPQMSELEPELRHVITQKKIVNLHKRSIQIQDEPKIMDIILYPYYLDPGIGAVIRLDDISNRLKMEELLIQSEKMMSLGGLAAGMAHEINNPLAGMMQNAQVIINRMTQPITANQKTAEEIGIQFEDIQAYMEKRKIVPALNHIKESGQAAAAIVENMLNFARKKSSTKQPEQIEKIISNSLDLAKNDWQPQNAVDIKQIHTPIEVQTDLQPVFCIGTKIQQVIFNIIKNAAEAMATATDTEKKPIIAFSISQNNSHTEIIIKDNGPGMNKTTCKQIFEPFFTTKIDQKGTGLGLSVSYFIIVEEHFGGLEVQSIPGQGTRFTITIPNHAKDHDPLL